MWIDCSVNELTSLPILPRSLEHLDCDDNQLKSLPPLPRQLWILNCIRNRLTSLPNFPASLNCINCDSNHISLLPPLPERLISLSCRKNPFDIFPELPLGLLRVVYDIHIDKTPLEYIDLSPERVQQLNREIQQWMLRKSKERTNERCKTYKEQIMMKAWHPTRVQKLLEMGYDIEDM